MTTVSLQPRVERCVELVREEYREMPGLNLTKPQMRRMWALDAPTCDAVLEALEREKFLKQTPQHLYVVRS